MMWFRVGVPRRHRGRRGMGRRQHRLYSTAMGYGTRARRLPAMGSLDRPAALQHGDGRRHNGQRQHSTALGSGTTASGGASTAMGPARPSGASARRWGEHNASAGLDSDGCQDASGAQHGGPWRVRSTAMGNETIASGSARRWARPVPRAIAAGSVGRAHADSTGRRVGDGSTTARQLEPSRISSFAPLAASGLHQRRQHPSAIGGGGWRSCRSQCKKPSVTLTSTTCLPIRSAMQEWPTAGAVPTSARWPGLSRWLGEALCASTYRRRRRPLPCQAAHGAPAHRLKPLRDRTIPARPRPARLRCAGTDGPCAAVAAEAQPLGTFRWQLQPFCNVVTVNVTQQGAVYTMDGFDDQCGATRRAPIVGLGTPNPDGSIGLGWNIVTTPGGRGVQVDARITLPSASGSWSDSAGNAGTLALGASTGGSARPLPATAAAIPSTFALLARRRLRGAGHRRRGPSPGLGTGHPHDVAPGQGGVPCRQRRGQPVGRRQHRH